jgi:hypothetical protein
MSSSHTMRSGLVVALGIILAWAATGLSTAPAVAAPPTEETYELLIFSNPVAGTEAQYNEWYDRQHAPDVVAVPGFLSAQRYVLSDQQLRGDAKGPTKYLIVFRIKTSDLAAVYAEVARRNRDKLIVQSSTFDLKTARSYTYRAITLPEDGAGGDAVPATSAPAEHYIQLVFSDAAPGKDEAFNRWYNEQHASHVASTLGFQSWQRYQLADTQLAPGPTEGGYLVIFDITTRDARAVFDQFKGIAPSPASGPGENGHILAGYTYKAIGPLIDGDRVRAERAATSK